MLACESALCTTWTAEKHNSSSVAHNEQFGTDISDGAWTHQCWWISGPWTENKTRKCHMDKWHETMRISRRARCFLSQTIIGNHNKQMFCRDNGAVSISKSLFPPWMKPYQKREVWSLSAQSLGERQDYPLDRSRVHHRTHQSLTHSHLHLQSSIMLFGLLGENRKTRRKPTQTNQNSTLTAWTDLNPESTAMDWLC